MECRTNFPIAVTGFGIRFPGDVNDEHSYWNLIRNGEDGIIDVPRDRWDVDRFYDPDPDKPGKMYVNKGGFLRAPIDEFDALYFGITPREAACMDPQQRLLLQVVWEALHNAGVVPEHLAGSNTGVYIGAFTLDNLIHQMGPLARDLIGPHTAVGSTMTILSNRISYLLDLRGPSLSIDTACSSSLVALHHACQAIWTGECDQALVGGVNVMFRPEYLIAMCKGKFLAPDGYCKTFDARADGYSRGEGAGAVVLKSLAGARRDGDPIQGIITATGVNQDGRSDGITSPNRSSQVALIRQVHAQAGIDPRQLSYMEAHGTGTQAGDNAESYALGEALGSHRDAEDPLPVGSVKANIGHLEAASGIAGLIKAMLCLKHQEVPPIANLRTPNPGIPFARLGLYLPRAPEPIRKSADVAYAAVNSFGYGGANAHALLQEVPSGIDARTLDGSTQSPSRAGRPFILTVSAKDPEALRELVRRHHVAIDQQPELDLIDYCYSCAVRRGHYQHRLAIVAHNREHLLAQLEEYARYGMGDFVRSGDVSGNPPRPVFVFTGMGPQWWAMGRELLRSESAFRQEVERCDAAFRKVSGWSILEEMMAAEDASRMASTTVAQSANFVLQAALAALWKSRGVEPEAIVGHSVGEVSAAYVSGVLTLDEAALVSYHRSRIQSRVAGQGGMLAVGLSEDQGHELLSDHPGAMVDIAAVNGPESLTLSGDREALQHIAEDLAAQGVFQRELQVEVPYHSPYMDPLLAEMRTELAGLNPQAPLTSLYSTVTGKPVQVGQYDAEYWCRNTRQAVLLAPAMQELLEAGHTLFLEVGPHPVLSTSIKQCAAKLGKVITGVSSLNRNTPEAATFALATAELYAAGCEIAWRSLFPEDCRYLPLPAYPWQNTAYWLESEVSRNDRVALPEHPLLGLRQSSPEPRWSTRLNAQLLPFLPDHCVEDLVVLPGAAYVELGLAAHHDLHQRERWVIEDLSFFNALLVNGDDEPELQLRCNDTGNAFAIHSRARDAQQWQAHAKGRFSLLPPEPAAALPLQDLLASMAVTRDQAQHYASMTEKKLQYGPSFRGVEKIWQGRDDSGRDCLAARIVTPEAVRSARERYHLHPTLLDACFQSLLSVLPAQDKRAYVPTVIRQIRYHARLPEVFYCYGSVDELSEEALAGNLVLCDESGRVLVELFGIRAKALSGGEHLSARELDEWLYDIKWELVDVPPTKVQGRWILAADFDRGDTFANRVCQELLGAGHQVIMVTYAEEYAQSSAVNYTLDPYRREHFERLAQAVVDVDCEGLVHFPPRQTDRSPVSDSKTLAALVAVQGITSVEGGHLPQLCFVSHCAQAVSLAPEELQLDESGVIALLRVAANEYPEYLLRSIDIDNSTEPQHLARVVCSDTRENEVALRGERLLAMRMARQAAQVLQAQCDADVRRSETFVVDIGTQNEPGIALVPGASGKLAPHEARLAVRAATLLPDELTAIGAAVTDNYGLNVRLCLGVADAVSEASSHGVAAGDDALVLTRAPLASHLIVSADELLQADTSLVREDNLGVVLALLAAQRALIDVAALRSGQTVLIHAADTPVGDAAVDIALGAGATVYVTLRDQAPGDALVQRGVADWYSSLSADFSEQIMRRTRHRGVDVVMNPFGDEITGHSLSIIAPGGHLLTFSASDDQPVLPLKTGVAVHALSMDDLLLNAVEPLTAALDRISQFLEQHDLALPAKRLIGVADLPVADPVELSAATALRIDDASHVARFKAGAMHLDADATYLITGGFGGFGQAITRYLAHRGARHLIIVSRNGPRTDEDVMLLGELRAQGVEVRVERVDVADAAQVADLFATTITAMSPLKGIVHTAGVLDDSPVSFVAPENLRRVMGPKVRGAWNLHRHSAGLPLDFFMLFSSVASMIGAAGQASYVIANVWLDNFAHLRRAQGLPAVSISWGALGEVGMAAVDPEVVAYFERVGLRPISPRKAVDAFAKALDWQRPHLGIVDMDWGAWSSYYPAWGKSPRYEHLVPESTDGADQVRGWTQDWLQLSAQEQLDDVLRRLIDIVAQSMKVPVAKISGGDNLPKPGIDSLIAMELPTVIQQGLDVRISTLELMKGNSLQQMAEQICAKYHDIEVAGTGIEPLTADIDEEPEKTVIDDLDDAQLDQLLKELA